MLTKKDEYVFPVPVVESSLALLLLRACHDIPFVLIKAFILHPLSVSASLCQKQDAVLVSDPNAFELPSHFWMRNVKSQRSATCRGVQRIIKPFSAALLSFPSWDGFRMRNIFIFPIWIHRIVECFYLAAGK